MTSPVSTKIKREMGRLMLPLQPLARHLAKELETPRHHHNWWQRCLLPRRRSSSRSRRKTRRRRRRRRWWTRWNNLLGSRSISCWCGGLRIGDQISNHFLRFSPNLVKPIAHWSGRVLRNLGRSARFGWFWLFWSICASDCWGVLVNMFNFDQFILVTLLIELVWSLYQFIWSVFF